MKKYNSKQVSSNQTETHPKLSRIISRHLHFSFKKPISPRALKTLDEIGESIKNHKGPLVLDSGCGTGESTIRIAELWPESLVLGIDKSASRLQRARRKSPFPNAHFFQILLEDCWLYACKNRWPLDAHFLLYPNPWPKKKHLGRRWYAHPIFKTLLHLSPHLQIRTNWHLYAEDFVDSALALSFGNISLETCHPVSPLTAFEKKYAASGHSIYKINVCPEIKCRTRDVLGPIKDVL